MITQSLLQDGDFDLKNNVQEKTYLDYIPVEVRFHGGIVNRRYLSFHLPGVSFLMLPFSGCINSWEAAYRRRFFSACPRPS